MSGGAIKKLRKIKIKEQLKQQRVDKQVNEIVDSLHEEMANMNDEQLKELSQAIIDLVDEKKDEE